MAEWGQTLVVWDFDWSLVNVNTDTWVLDELDRSGELGLEPLIHRCRAAASGWTAQMDWALGELHAQGTSAAAIDGVLARTPLLRGVVAAVAAGRAHRADQIIVSDANERYIESVLSARADRVHRSTFRAVVTNGAHEEASGRLRVLPYHPTDAPKHGCPRCPPNMCKSRALRALLGAALAPGAARPRIAYIGDGSGDFCPSCTVLRDGDLVLARRAPHGRLLELCGSDRCVFFMYRYILRESCSQFDSLPLTSLTISCDVPIGGRARAARHASSLGAARTMRRATISPPRFPRGSASPCRQRRSRGRERRASARRRLFAKREHVTYNGGRPSAARPRRSAAHSESDEEIRCVSIPTGCNNSGSSTQRRLGTF
jgi:pyridoxal phosphate phosphatase PHOSPHO2